MTNQLIAECRSQIARIREKLAKGTHPFGACRSDREPDLCSVCESAHSTKADLGAIETLIDICERYSPAHSGGLAEQGLADWLRAREEARDGR